MSYADERFIQNCRDILTNGVWDTELEVRPHWEDGTPAHTVKKFGIINRYDLREEFPILTLRRTYFKTCIDELLWIWQQKSNNIHDLRGHIWDSWADGTGSIGKAYGYQLAVKHQYPEGEFDQVDRVLYDLKHNPASRRIMTNIYNFQDLHEMALYPCAYSMTFNVSGHTLNAILNQRSQDMLAANNWNVVQYAVLVHMMAQVSGLEAGELVHVIADAHIYDRHVPIVERMLEKEPRPAPRFVMDPSVTDFYRFTRDSFSLGEFDQVDRVLYDLKHNPASRRIMTNIYNFQDLHEMALYPCAYSMTFNVSGHTLNAILNQRSQDMLAANNWNVVQYAVLVHMMAQVSGLEAGELVHVIADAHIYDRHVPIVERMLEKEPRPAPRFVMDPSVTDFYRFTRDSFSLEGYEPHPFEDKIPVAI